MKTHIRRSPGVSLCKRLVLDSAMTSMRLHVERARPGTCKNCIKALAKHEAKTKREWH